MKIYSQCENLLEENNRSIFENNFNKYINECLEDYEYFKLIYFDGSMKAIIQEDNYPLSYSSIDYPYIKYFVISHYAKLEDLEDKRHIKGCYIPMINSFIDDRKKVGIIDDIDDFI